MNPNMLKGIFNMKIKIIGSITKDLPEPSRERIQDIQYKLITSMSEAINAYLEKGKGKDKTFEKNKGNEKNKGIKTVNIE